MKLPQYQGLRFKLLYHLHIEQDYCRIMVFRFVDQKTFLIPSWQLHQCKQLLEFLFSINKINIFIIKIKILQFWQVLQQLRLLVQVQWIPFCYFFYKCQLYLQYLQVEHLQAYQKALKL